MKIKFKTLKPGSMLIYKRHNYLKRLWYKLLKKELPYNEVVLFLKEIDLMDTFTSNSPTLLAELKKPYSKIDITKLELAADSQLLRLDNEEFYSIRFEGANQTDLMNILNKVRPNTLSNNTITELINSKYYNVKRIAEETDWDVCIY